MKTQIRLVGASLLLTMVLGRIDEESQSWFDILAWENVPAIGIYGLAFYSVLTLLLQLGRAVTSRSRPAD